MHHAQVFVDSQIASAGPTAGPLFFSSPLNSAQASALRRALGNDAADYLYNGALSIGDATRAIERSLFSWATVKLYYSTFYLARSILASNGRAVVYKGTKPYGLSCGAGDVASKRSGTTHKAVLGYFASSLPNSPLLSQDIAATDPLDWLMARREEVNYTNSRFVEPMPPRHFEVIAREGLRRSIAAYVKDETSLYAFDPDHAMLALPIQALKEALSQAGRAGCATFPDVDARAFAQGLFSDKAGPMPEMVQLFKA